MLVGLYEEPERPPNAVDYIKRYMGAPTGVDVEALRRECEQLKVDKATLESTVQSLNSRVSTQSYVLLVIRMSSNILLSFISHLYL